MYQEGFYKTIDHECISEDVRRDGFEPILINDPPGRAYSPHTHPETKLLVFMKGSMEVKVKGDSYHCKPGDKLIIPGNVEHSAHAGPEGWAFFWSEKL